MNIPFRLSLLLAMTLGFSAAAHAAEPDTRVYELRTYTAMPGKTNDVLARFRDHTVKLFEKQGMVNVGYWVPTEVADGAGEKLIYLLEHKSRDAATAAWKNFGADPDWVTARKASEVNGRIVAKAEFVFLAATDFSPAVKSEIGKGAPRVFELRTYTAPEGKLDALDARFRDHTLKLFAKHGMTNLGYFHSLDANKGAGRTLIYFLAHASREAADASWKAFRADPVWKAALAASEVGGKLTEEVKTVFLTPVDFSATK